MRVLVIVAVLVAGLVGCTSGDDEVPVVDPGSVQEVDTPFGVPLEDIPDGMTGEVFPEDRGELIGPHFEMKLSWRATGPALTESGVPAALGPARAPDGEELLLVAMEYPHVQDGLDEAPTAELVVDGTATALERLTYVDNDPEFRGGVILMASVPIGRPVALRVTDAGRTQTLDVRTGDRGEDAIDLYYRNNTQEMDTSTSLTTGVTTPAGHHPFELTVGYAPPDGSMPTTAALTAFSDTWAPDGRAWLVVPRPGAAVRSDASFYRLTVDDPTVFTLRLPDGTVLPALPGGGLDVSRDALSTIPSGPHVLFDVPADFSEGVFVTSLGAAPISDADQPGSWSPAPAPFEVPIAFG